jgi:hypothetical protein
MENQKKKHLNWYSLFNKIKLWLQVLSLYWSQHQAKWEHYIIQKTKIMAMPYDI